MLFLTSDNSSSVGISPSVYHHLHRRRLIFIENQPQSLRCFSTGGYPTPDIAIYLNERDISGQFALTSTTSFFGKQGLRLMVTQTDRSTDGLSLTADDDNGRIKCIVTVPGLMANVTEVSIEIHCKYSTTFHFQIPPKMIKFLFKAFCVDLFWGLNNDRSEGRVKCAPTLLIILVVNSEWL